MGNMAPADCATPALVVGSNLLRWSLPHLVSLGFCYPLRCPIFADNLQ